MHLVLWPDQALRKHGFYLFTTEIENIVFDTTFPDSSGNILWLCLYLCYLCSNGFYPSEIESLWRIPKEIFKAQR